MNKKIAISTLATVILGNSTSAYEIVPEATMADSPTTLMGVNHIGLTVKDLDIALEFYQSASGYPLIRRQVVRDSEAADTLFGRDDIEYEIAVLEGPNMLFELMSFSHNADREPQKMPAQGPGMTHTCFQSASTDSGYHHFRQSGAEMLSRGDDAVDMAGYGVTYAYGYDHEGNMFEMEQLEPRLLASAGPLKDKWLEEGYRMWMTQVALVTNDLVRLTDWYEKVLAYHPYREGEWTAHPGMEKITDYDGLDLEVTWFRMANPMKTLEFWKYNDPMTTAPLGKRDVTDFGYSYSFEVGDIQTEYQRMKDLGVEFISEPVRTGDKWQVYANDVDGNVFSLRQWVDSDSPYSIPNLEQ